MSLDISLDEIRVTEVFEYNITHNLSEMARAAGLYNFIWHPQHMNIIKAEQLIKPLTIGLNLLKSDPDMFRPFNAANGWGVYEDFVIFVEKYLTACKEYPDANVNASS